MNSKRDFHVHNDIDFMRKASRLPLSYFDNAEVYIMQQDRIVFIGLRSVAEKWLTLNHGLEINVGAYMPPPNNEWFSINQRLPDRGGSQGLSDNVLTTNGSWVMILQYDHYYQNWEDKDGNVLMSDDITHWMELPKPIKPTY